MGDEILDQIEAAQHSRVKAVAAVMDAHQWHPSLHRCECGAQMVDWWMWRGHVAPLIALDHGPI